MKILIPVLRGVNLAFRTTMAIGAPGGPLNPIRSAGDAELVRLMNRLRDRQGNKVEWGVLFQDHAPSPFPGHTRMHLIGIPKGRSGRFKKLYCDVSFARTSDYQAIHGYSLESATADATDANAAKQRTAPEPTHTGKATAAVAIDNSPSPQSTVLAHDIEQGAAHMAGMLLSWG